MNKGNKSLINIILVLIVISALGGFGYFLWGDGESFVPENFINARERSAAIASELVFNLDLSLKGLSKISEEDRNYRFSSALNLVEEESKNVEAAMAKASELSDELSKMAQVVRDIKPSKAKNLALEAVSQEVSLIARLINYNAYFSGLLITLKMKFVEDTKYDSSDVQKLIENMNKERKEINSINESFNQKLKDFDKAL